MENRHTGFIMIGISVALVFIILLFRNAIKKIVTDACLGDHGLSCPMYDAINQQTYLTFAVVGILAIMGLALVFSKPNEKIVVKKVRERKQKTKIDISDLREEDRKLFKIIKEHKTVFQADLIEETGFSKQKISRMIDRLQGRDLVERKRRGMTNVIVLKD